MSRNQNFKNYGRGKHSNHPGTVVNSSIQFDKFFFNNSNKPTAAKSAGTIGKWGMTSFTSLRSSSFTVGHSKETSRFSSLGKKRTQPAPDTGLQIKRPVLNNNIKRDSSPLVATRKFFKSRNAASDDPNQKSYKSNSSESKKSSKHSRSVDENKKQKNFVLEENKSKTAGPIVRAFEKQVKFSSKKSAAAIKITTDDAPFPDDFHNLQNLPSPPKERDKPPIVLRIFKGTSQLISETGNAKSDASDAEGSPTHDGSTEDNQPAAAVTARTPYDEHIKENVIASPPPAPEPTVSTRSLRRRSPDKPLPLAELAVALPKPASRRGREKSKSPSPELSPVKTRSTRRRSPEKTASPEPPLPPLPAIKIKPLRRRSPVKSPTPEPPTLAIKIKPLRRRSPEKSPSPEPPPPPPPAKTRAARRHSPANSASPEPPAVKTRATRRHSPERLSASPEQPLAKTRSARRRSPDTSKSPSPESTITTRSLRRRVPLPEPPAVPPPHTSPKRVLRSTKTVTAAAVAPPAPPAGKIVITNLNSDHPSVYLSDDGGAAVPPLRSPSRKDPKEVRGYTNRNKNRQPKTEAKPDVHPESTTAAAAETDAEPILQKVEEILADIKTEESATEAVVDAAATHDVNADKVPGDSSLDEDRAELLQLLEDDEEVETGRKGEKNPPANVAEPGEGDACAVTVVNAEPLLKIRIKIPKLCRDETAADLPPISDSQDSGIDLKCEAEQNSSSSAVGLADSDSMVEHASEASTKELDEPSEATTNSDSELRPEAAHSSVPLAAVAKKGSIFKHRGSSDGNKKRLALYKHKWADDKDAANNTEEDKGGAADTIKSKAVDSMLDMELDDMPLTKFIRQPATESFDFDEPATVTGVKCAKKNKDFYTVVRNVKKAHQIQESGEFQEFNDDVEYILDALQDNNPIGTRCLSAITLATKCTEPAFRMHVRAHGTVTKFFRALHDATKDQSLGLCTATVMFVLSQDRLNMDLDRDSLELMLNLLESDASHTKALEDCGLTDSQLTKTRDRVGQICADIQAQGHAKHLNLDNITVGHLSMETLLSLTSKRAGEWFKEELRELGGLEHIIRTVVECCKHVDDTANAWSTTSLEKIRKVDRCLRVLENITMQNEQNNDYLLDFQNGILIDTLVRMYKVCDYEIPLYPTYSIADKESTGAVLRECLIANLKVLINITHDYQSKSHGSRVIGSRPGVIESSLHVLLQVPQYIPKEEKFDLMLLTLIMLINLVEHCEPNRKAIIEAKAPSNEESIFETKAREPAVKALIAMFYNYEELARHEEKKTDAILEGENAEKPPNNAPQKVHEDFIEETISQLVQKAGQNMEHTLIAAYVVMLIGYLIIDNEDFEKFVRNHLPEKNFQFMTSVLQKFYSFMTLTVSGGTVSNRGMKSIQMVIQQLIDSDRRHGFDAQMLTASSHSETSKSSDAGSSKDTDTDSNSTQSRFCESQSTSGVAISAS